MKLHLLPLALIAAAASAFAAPLDPLFSAENLWTMKQNDFMAVAGRLGYEWTSNARDSARVARKDRHCAAADSAAACTGVRACRSGRTRNGRGHRRRVAARSAH